MTFYVFELLHAFSRKLALTRVLGGRAVVDSVTSMYGTDRQTDGRIAECPHRTAGGITTLITLRLWYAEIGRGSDGWPADWKQTLWFSRAENGTNWSRDDIKRRHQKLDRNGTGPSRANPVSGRNVHCGTFRIPPLMSKRTICIDRVKWRHIIYGHDTIAILWV